ncbi:MAG: histidinol-phosphatase [Nitrospiraceae bacterium]
MTDTNRTLAERFRAMAELLAIRRANPHRVRAYRRAAESLSALQEDVSAVAARGALQHIPGIGRDLSGKIQEFLKTGTIQSYEELKISLPPEVASWTALPGLSDTVVQHLYFRLGIRTLADLETLVRSRLLRTLPGVTVSDEDLLAAIQARQRPGPSR